MGVRVRMYERVKVYYCLTLQDYNSEQAKFFVSVCFAGYARGTCVFARRQLSSVCVVQAPFEPGDCVDMRYTEAVFV